MELTKSEFWDDYWSNQGEPSGIDGNFSFDRCMAKSLTKTLKHREGQSILEIGCAPGRWMAFCGANLGLVPSGIEYSPVGIKVTRQNLESLKIPYGSFHAGDFFKIESEPIYDVVTSFGFIEHFKNVEEVVQRHCAWLKPGGTLILGVPNFTGVYRPLQLLLDSATLRRHNTSIMNKRFFIQLQDTIGMTLQEFRHIGSFEPSLPLSMQGGFDPVRWFLAKTLVVLARLRNPFRAMDSLNNRYISSYLFAVYKR